MTETVNVANNTLLQQQVGEQKRRKEEEHSFFAKSASPTPTSSSKDDCSVGSSELTVRGPSMGEDGQEKNEIIVEFSENGAPLTVTSIKDEASAAVESFTLSDGERSRNPDPDERSENSGVVVPSVIRISPKTNGKKKTNATRDSPRLSVVRPVANKTPPQEPSAPTNGKPRPGTHAAAAAKGKSPAHMGERGGKGDKKKAPQKEDNRRRDETQTSFPRRNKPKRMTSGRGSHADGQAPTQHVQYSNAGARHAQHANRQDPHGYRQHGRGAHAASMTSSVGGGTPTLAARRAPHHPRGLSTGSDMDGEPSPSVLPATPLFQRLVTEEVQELKTYTRIIEEQNRRVTELERRTADLDKRLQKKDKEKADLERTLEYRETEWSNKFERLESDRDHQKELVEQEKRMNTKLNYQVVQMEQEIHKFLTRKVCVCVYEIEVL